MALAEGVGVSEEGFDSVKFGAAGSGDDDASEASLAVALFRFFGDSVAGLASLVGDSTLASSDEFAAGDDAAAKSDSVAVSERLVVGVGANSGLVFHSVSLGLFAMGRW